MLRAVNVLSRTTLVTLAALVTALVIILAQSPLWLDAVPLTFKVFVVSVAVLSFFRPQDGLLVVAGLSAIGLVAGRLIDSVARGSETLVLAFLVGWFLSVWRPRDRRQWSFTSLHLPVVLFGLVVLASLIEQLWFLQIQTSFPEPFLEDLWRYVSRDYLLGPMMGFSMMRHALLLIEGLGLMMAVIAISRTNDAFVPRLVRMTLAGAMGAALINVVYAIGEVIGSGASSNELVDALLHRRWSVHIGDINAAGSYFAMVLPIAIGTASTCRARQWIWLLPGGVLIGLALWMTGARAAQVGLLLVLLLLVTSRIVFTRSRRERSLMIWAAAFAPAAAIVMALWLSGGPARVMPERGLVQMTATEAVKDRLLFTQGSLGMWASRPAFGVGIGQYYLWSAHYFPPALLQVHPRENAHNFVLQVAAELGAVGLVLFLWVLGVAARPLGMAVRHVSPDPLQLGLAAGLGAFMISALGGQPFLVPPVVYSFWLLLGVAATFGHMGTSRASAQRRPTVLTGADRPITPAPRAVSSRPRVLVLGLTVVLGASMSTRVAREVDQIDVTRVTYGLHQWETESDGTRFRWTGGRAKLFLPATASHVDLPLRAMLVGDNRDAITVEISIDDRRSLPLQLLDGNWRVQRVRLPPPGSGARYRTVALRVERPWRPSEAIPGSTDTRELGVKLGEVEVASGLTIVP